MRKCILIRAVTVQFLPQIMSYYPAGHDIPAMSVYIGKLLPNVIELGVDEASASHAITSIVSPMGETMLMYEVCDKMTFEDVCKLATVMF